MYISTVQNIVRYDLHHEEIGSFPTVFNNLLFLLLSGLFELFIHTLNNLDNIEFYVV